MEPGIRPNLDDFSNPPKMTKNRIISGLHLRLAVPYSLLIRNQGKIDRYQMMRMGIGKTIIPNRQCFQAWLMSVRFLQFEIAAIGNGELNRYSKPKKYQAI